MYHAKFGVLGFDLLQAGNHEAAGARDGKISLAHITSRGRTWNSWFIEKYIYNSGPKAWDYIRHAELENTFVGYKRCLLNLTKYNLIYRGFVIVEMTMERMSSTIFRMKLCNLNNYHDASIAECVSWIIIKYRRKRDARLDIVFLQAPMRLDASTRTTLIGMIQARKVT